jgi:hypothetical protein
MSPLGEQMSLYPSRCRLVVNRERSDGNRDGAGHVIIFVVALLASCPPFVLRTRGAQWDREVPRPGGRVEPWVEVDRFYHPSLSALWGPSLRLENFRATIPKWSLLLLQSELA